VTDFVGRGEGGALLGRLRGEIKTALERRDASPVRLPTFAIANLPAAARLRGRVVFVESTARPAYSDGTVWRYFDGSAV
jgi:hypothetical protein